MTHPDRSLRRSILEFVVLVLVPSTLCAGTASVFPSSPNSRTPPTIRYHETDWHDSCPPVVTTSTIDGQLITVQLSVEPTCIPEMVSNPYTAVAGLDQLDPGTYQATVFAPDFNTGQTESDSVLFEVVPAVNCESRERPGASLLLPYFEANLDDPEGQRTLFAIGSVANHDTLAHVVLWTNWGWPIVSFDTVLPVNGMKTFDVATLLAGNFPTVDPPPDTLDCTTPIANPTLDPAEIRALFTGQPSGDNGLCYSIANDNPAVATGYITVDVVRGCSGDQVVDPWDPGYFEEDLEASRATQENVLWGDFYLVNSGQNLAEGETLVALFADTERYGVDTGGITGTTHRSFYGDHDHRMPLSKASRARFLDGGAFAADTEILAWASGSTGPNDCSEPLPTGFSNIFSFQLYDERGELLADEGLWIDEVVRRFKLGENTPVSRPFGVIDMRVTFFNGIIGVPLVEDVQSWMLPIVRAEGRFGVASGSMPVEDFCHP